MTKTTKNPQIIALEDLDAVVGGRLVGRVRMVKKKPRGAGPSRSSN